MWHCKYPEIIKIQLKNGYVFVYCILMTFMFQADPTEKTSTTIARKPQPYRRTNLNRPWRNLRVMKRPSWTKSHWNNNSIDIASQKTFWMIFRKNWKYALFLNSAHLLSYAQSRFLNVNGKKVILSMCTYTQLAWQILALKNKRHKLLVWYNRWKFNV